MANEGYSRRQVLGWAAAGVGLGAVAAGPIGYLIGSHSSASPVSSARQPAQLEALTKKSFEKYSDAQLQKAYNDFFDKYGPRLTKDFSDLMQRSGTQNLGALPANQYEELVDSTITSLAREDADVKLLLAEVRHRGIDHDPNVSRLKIRTDILYSRNGNSWLPTFNDPELLFRRSEYYMAAQAPLTLTNAQVYQTRTGRTAVKYGSSWIPLDYFDTPNAQGSFKVGQRNDSIEISTPDSTVGIKLEGFTEAQKRKFREDVQRGLEELKKKK